jgi:hypothetical protein
MISVLILAQVAGPDPEPAHPLGVLNVIMVPPGHAAQWDNKDLRCYIAWFVIRLPVGNLEIDKSIKQSDTLWNGCDTVAKPPLVVMNLFVGCPPRPPSGISGGFDLDGGCVSSIVGRDKNINIRSVAERA